MAASPVYSDGTRAEAKASARWFAHTGERRLRGLLWADINQEIHHLVAQGEANRIDPCPGERPRTDYVVLAEALDADVMDMDYMQDRATALARLLARRAMVPAQVLEAFLCRRTPLHVVARADRMGLPLALLNKLTGGRRDVVLVSAWLSVPKKAVFLSRFKVQSHLAAIVNYSSVQLAHARDHLGVDSSKLHHALQPVDERFFVPMDVPLGDYVCAVGSEARDYGTFVEAVSALQVRAEIAVGSSVLAVSGDLQETFRDVLRDATRADEGAPLRVHIQLDPLALRDLYSRARVVVVPLLDVDSDCGVTVIAEAMAMGKPVVVTGTRGQVDLVRHGENGLYVPPGDPAALRAAIQRLLDDPDEAARMGRAGRALVEERLTLDHWVRTVAALTRTSAAE